MRQLKITTRITNRESKAVIEYLEEISKFRPVQAEEEAVLAVQIRQGDVRAFEKLVKSNLRFVVSVAKQYQNQGLALLDLINEDNCGLIKAARRFDETRGFKFISYAVWWIRQSILQALAEQSRIVRLPLNKVGLSNKITKAYAQLEQECEREPSTAELAELLDISTEEVETTLHVAGRYVSIDAPFADVEDATMHDIIPETTFGAADAQVTHCESLRTEIKHALSVLTQRQRDVIMLYFGIGTENALSLDDIGSKFGLTRERTRQIKEKALRRLKISPAAPLLKAYV